MTTSEERRQMARMVGLPSETPRFKNKPTPIAVPRNNPSQFQSRADGRNPFSRTKDRSSSSSSRVGNLTSSRTLTRGSRGQDDQGPPAKRRKVETSDQPSSSGQGKYVHSRPRLSLPPLGPETIDVDDFIDEPDFQVASGSSFRRQSSPDELNIPPDISSFPPRPSRYPFLRQNMQGSEKNRAIILVPDGEDTTWAQNQSKFDDNDNESDPIEGSTDNLLPSSYYNGHTEGIVRGRVKKIDLKCEEEAVKKIDLSARQKQKKTTSMAKNMKPRNPLQKQTLPAALKFEEEYKTRESSTTLSARKEKEPFPVKEAYLDNHFYPTYDGQKLEMFWNSDLVCIKADDDEVFKILLDPEHCKSFQVSHISEAPPIFNLQNTNNSTATIRLDRHYSGANCVKLEKAAKLANLKPHKVSTPNALWECAVQAAKQFERSHSTTPERKQADGTKNSSSRAPKSLNQNQEIAENRSEKVARLVALRDPQNQKDSSTPSNNRKRKEPLDPSLDSPLTNAASSSPGPVELKMVSETPSRPRRNTRQETYTSNVRRSTRIAPPKEREVVADKLILVYPPGPGAVNINMSDLGRLEQGEYLNDTLIEFGLKLWLRGLEEENPTLASQIHIFNSFFYKKLNQGKDVQQTFESVKKWTSKFDIFEKKYIIVPINEHLHWYLAIICEPGHILSPKTPNPPSARKQTRSIAQAVAKAFSPTETSDDKDDQNVTSSEAEVERNLNDEFQSSCIIENDEDSELSVNVIADDDDATSSTALSYVTHKEEGDDRLSSSPLSEHPKLEAMTRSPSASSSGMVVDSTEEIVPPPNYNAISTDLFYQDRPKSRKGKEKARSEADILILNDSVEEIVDDEALQQTYIFIMDSLGTRHPQAVNKLSKYLKMEGKDKKGISEAGSAIGRFASVPVQPNFCDCGVYLLHFAKTFMSDPVRYTKGILAQPPKSIANKERQKTWNDSEVANMRDNLKETIKHLSDAWKKERSLEMAANDVDAGSDDDVIILDTKSTKDTKATSGSKRSSKSATAEMPAPVPKTAAARLRGR